MVYESIAPKFPAVTERLYHASGYYIVETEHPFENDARYSVFTDDGNGNGVFVCEGGDLYWMRRIAHGLDKQRTKFDIYGNPIK